MPDTGAAAALIPALSRPDCYPHRAEKIEKLETHISWVFLTGPYAYKVKKPLNLEFLDFSTLDARRHFCEEELRLNRRLAPEVYLDVVEIRGSPEAPRIAGPGPVIEYALRMRQFPQDALASQLFARGELTPALMSAFASQLARFHGDLPPASDQRYGAPESVLHNALQNFAQISSLLMSTDDREALQIVRDWTEREFMLSHRDMAERRVAGFVRECHGDLHLGNIVLLDGKLVPFDCIEFNAELRWNDLMSEVAFLVMDLMDRGAPHLGWLFLNAYLEATGDYSGLPTLRFYLVYRAMVRAKIHLIRAQQSAVKDAEERRLMEAYRSYVHLAVQCAHLGRPAVLLMHGFSGCGKSMVALEIVQTLGAIRVRSDIERKRLLGTQALGLSATAVAGGLYGQDYTVATYTRLAEVARSVAQAGYTAVVDATFLRRSQRAQLQEVAAFLDVPIALVDVQAPEALLRARIASRAAAGSDPSEATVYVLEHQIATSEAISDDEGLNVIAVDGRERVAPSAVMEVSRFL